MKELLLYLERSPYSARTTSGELFMCYDGKKESFCYTLEDTARPSNIKVYGETCIPEGTYRISLFENPHYGKTLIIHTEDDKVTILAGQLKWVGCLFHNGLDISHTEGCVLVGSKRVSNDLISNGMKEKLRIFVENKMNEGYSVSLQIVNLTQTA